MAKRKTSTQQSQSTGNARKDPEEWTTGDEPMTAAQHSYLKTLCDEAGEPMDETLTKAQAAQRIARRVVLERGAVVLRVLQRLA